MAAFGFSVGDFIAGAGLIHNIAQSLRTAGGSKAAYLEVSVDLEGLAATLCRVHSLEANGYHLEISELRKACEACLDKIAEFEKKIAKYEVTLKNGGSGYRVQGVKELWHKIEWGVLREQEVKEFKAALNTPLQRVSFLQQGLALHQGSIMLGIQTEHGEYLKRILGAVESFFGHPNEPPLYEESQSEDIKSKWHDRSSFLPTLSSPPRMTKDIDNVLKELRILKTQFKTCQGNSDATDGLVVNVIMDTSRAFEGLQKEAEKLKWSELSKILDILPKILEKYEKKFTCLPNKTKTHVVDAMGKILESSLNFTDQTIALLRKHQRDSGPKSGHGIGNRQVLQYDRVGRCITNLAQVASQFDGFVSSPVPSDKDIKPEPIEQDFNSKGRGPLASGTGLSGVITSFQVDVELKPSKLPPTLCEGQDSSIKHAEEVNHSSSGSGKALKGMGVTVADIQPHKPNSPVLSVLLRACQEREIDLIHQLLQMPDIILNEADNQGRGVLHLALGSGKVNADGLKMMKIANIVNLLATRGADVNASDNSGLRPIHYCAQTINYEATKYLLKHGARINERDAKERTALNYTALDSHPDIEFVKMLIARGGKLGLAKLPKLPPRANVSQKMVRVLVAKL